MKWIQIRFIWLNLAIFSNHPDAHIDPNSRFDPASMNVDVTTFLHPSPFSHYVCSFKYSYSEYIRNSLFGSTAWLITSHLVSKCQRYMTSWDWRRALTPIFVMITERSTRRKNCQERFQRKSKRGEIICLPTHFPFST